MIPSHPTYHILQVGLHHINIATSPFPLARTQCKCRTVQCKHGPHTMTLYLILVYPYDNRRDNNFVFNYIHTPGTSVQIIKATLKKYKFPCQIYSTHFYVIMLNRLEIVLVQFQYNRLYRKLSYLYRNILAKFKSQYYID